MMRKKKPSSKSYDIGYGKPPKNHRFRKGESGAELTAGQLEDST